MRVFLIRSTICYLLIVDGSRKCYQGYCNPANSSSVWSKPFAGSYFCMLGHSCLGTSLGSQAFRRCGWVSVFCFSFDAFGGDVIPYRFVALSDSWRYILSHHHSLIWSRQSSPFFFFFTFSLSSPQNKKKNGVKKTNKIEKNRM